MKRAKLLNVFLSVCIAVMCMAGLSVSASADQSLYDCEVWVDAYEGTVTVAFGDDNVPEDAYTLIFFTYEKTDDGEKLDRVGTEFPTEDGTYIATVTAKEGSGYTDAARSEPFSISGLGENDISDGEVWIDTDEQTVTVELNGETVPSDAYHVIFFSYMATENGEQLENVGSEFPTVPGPYIAAVVANEDSGFTGENRSDPFTVGESEYDLSDSIVYVTVEAQEVTVRLHGGLVPSDAYHVIFFSYMATEDGEKLENVGSEFPTVPGPYIAAIVANEGSEFTGENRSDPFTVEAAGDSNPKTGAELPGLALLALSAAAAGLTMKKKG